MPEFILNGRESKLFTDLPAMAQGFIEALFFTECSQYTMAEWDEPSTQESITEGTADGTLPSDSGFAELHSDSVATILEFCARFERSAGPLLELAYQRDDYDAVQAGRDLLYTYAGHGVGFWDRTQLEDDSEQYEALTAAMIAASQSGDNDAWGRACSARSAIESLGDKLTAACGRGEVNAWFGDHVTNGDAPFVYVEISGMESGL